MIRRYLAFAAQGRVLVACAVTTALLMLAVFPALPLGADALDLMPHYTHADVVAAMEQYGPRGRRLYAWVSPTLDTLFPIAYVTLFAGLLYRFRPAEALWMVALFPVIAGLWDLAENVQITAMLVQYPEISERQVAWASFFTETKHRLTPVYTGLAATFLAVAAIRRAARRVSG